MAQHVDQEPLAAADEAAVTGILDPVGGLDGEETLAFDTHIKMAARAAKLGLRKVGPDTLQTIDPPVRVVARVALPSLVHLAKKQAVALEARYLGIGQIVGDGLVPGRFGQHARCGDKYAFDHFLYLSPAISMPKPRLPRLS